MSNKIDIEKKRWAELAGITLNESTRNEKETSFLVEYATAINGITLGIVKENQKFYIKKSDKQGNGLIAEDFDYLSGHMYRSEASFNSINRAKKELSNYISEINENFRKIDDSFDIRKFREKFLKENEEEQQEAPVEMPAEQPAPAETVDTSDIEDEVKIDATEISNAPAETSGGEEEEGLDSVASIVGRFSQELGEREITPEEGKSILNTAITIVSRIMPEMEDTEKEAFIKRIENNGQKLDEEETMNEEKMPFGENEDMELEIEDDEDIVSAIHSSLQDVHQEDHGGDDDKMLEIDLEDKKIKIPFHEAKKVIKEEVKKENAKRKIVKIVEAMTDAILEGKQLTLKNPLNKEIYKNIVEEMEIKSRKMLREFVEGKKIEPKNKVEKAIYSEILSESKTNKKLLESVKKHKLKLIKEAIARKTKI